MSAAVGVLYEDQLAAVDPVFRSIVEQMPALQLISEAELDQSEPQSKAALISVQAHTIASALVRITTLKKQWPNLRILVAIQVMDAVQLRKLVDAGADSFVTRRPSLDDLCAALCLRVEDLPCKAGTLPAAATETHSLALTHRETEILRLLSAGFSNKEVARRLDLSARTVEAHRLNLRRKTQTGRLKDLVALARTLGLAPVHDVKPFEQHRFAQPSAPR
ncbi:response regulator transcription factor [Methylobacterium sp. Leaf111]|uniref:response regulator transcription factor n=1 Tax=Methylobacterium sp. Leaf111 TaxID=1736257 RepID=UPI0009E6FCC6|nr:response regulator transcription factor [Methylobacterium sp. Leaf111]